MQSNNYRAFLKLHQQGRPFLLGNAWNVASAKLLEQKGFPAIGTSSLAIANSLGYRDGEAIPFNELLFIIKRILANINVPLSVDMETGYSKDLNQVVQHLQQLCELGVAGINLEDSVSIGNTKELVPADVFSKKLETIRNELAKKDMQLFINARIDAFLLKSPSALEITLERIKQYEQAGADGIFILFVSDTEAIRKITAATKLPVNLICMPGLSSIGEIAELGARRISLGGRFYQSVYTHAGNLLEKVNQQQSLSPLFE